VNRAARRPATPASTATERWHQNGFNLAEVIVIRDGPAPDGTRYVDGRHSIRVAVFEAVEDAEAACAAHNAALTPETDAWAYGGFCG
jgi:hypothetical protein